MNRFFSLLSLVLMTTILLLPQGNHHATAVFLTPSPHELAKRGVTRNEEWPPYSEFFDGVEMMLVPTGCFMMGSTEEQISYGESLTGGSPGWARHERPANEVCFEQPFWIDRYEVTNGQFAVFGGEAARASNWKTDLQPREQITWTEARDFCALRGVRLPTEAEWEYAARGPDALIFPWGNEFIAENVIADGSSERQTAAVNTVPNGRSWVGAYHLSGNVWEWTSTIFHAYPYQELTEDEVDEVRYVLRGASWWDFAFLLRAANRHRILPNNAFWDIGFRCAKNY